jgi:hypothetical protein
MATGTNSNSRFPTAAQVPDHAILDQFNRQTYLGNAFVLPIAGISLSGTSETNILLMTNPSTNKSLFVNLRRYSSSAQAVLVKTYIASSISTTGIANIPVNLRPANPTMSASACYANGQFSLNSNGTLVSAVGCSSDYFITEDNSLMFIIDPGQTLLITATALIADTIFNADVSWFEI